MINIRKVKSRMVELGLDQGDVASALGVSRSTACQKLNRVRPLDLAEAEKLAELLRLQDAQFREYFFAS